MHARFLSSAILSIFSLFVLVVSIYQASEIKYSFHLAPSPTPSVNQNLNIDYHLSDPGRIGPRNVLWPIKAMRDRLWLVVNPDLIRKAEISLLLSDKRLVVGRDIFEFGQSGTAVATLVKAEIYLKNSFEFAQEAYADGYDDPVFMEKLSTASLKHREVLETIHAQAPEDAKPLILQTMDHSKRIYEKTSQILREMQKEPISSPFEKG